MIGRESPLLYTGAVCPGIFQVGEWAHHGSPNHGRPLEYRNGNSPLSCSAVGTIAIDWTW